MNATDFLLSREQSSLWGDHDFAIIFNVGAVKSSALRRASHQNFQKLKQQNQQVF